jgi:aldehyde:ferredoxin oxidoreductase
MKGYMGKILRVDLTSGDIRRDEFAPDFARRFLGGNGFAAKIIHDTVPETAEPLSPENAVVFATGPFNNTPVWGTGRGHLASISPQTGFFADSNFGGNLATMLKRSGFDAVVITGRAQSPVYLSVNNDSVSLRSAEKIWGKTSSESHELITEHEGSGIETALIGPAGENRVIFASVMCSGNRISAAGRGGIGAVLGYKNLKGLAIRGSGEVVIASRDRLIEKLRSLFPDVKEKAKVLTSIGTPFLVKTINSMGKLGTHNIARETFDRADEISGELIAEKYRVKNVACYGCPIACGKIVSVPGGEFAGRSVKMPEYETLYSIGSMIDNGDIVSIFNGNAMCDEMGIDTISFGVTLAFLAECVERGIVSDEELGTRISFGEFENLSDIVKKTAYREGIGELLSVGSERLAERLGHGSDKFLYTVKGLEIAGHSPRGVRTMGLSYAISTRGGSHHDARPVYLDPSEEPGFSDQPAYCIKSNHATAIGDSLVMCRFFTERAFGRELENTLAEMIQLVTGWDIDLNEMNTIGERIYNLERLINVRRGLTRLGDTLPYRVMNEPIPDGPVKGRFCPRDELDKMLDEYYRLRGWDERGIPTDEKLKELGLI